MDDCFLLQERLNRFVLKNWTMSENNKSITTAQPYAMRKEMFYLTTHSTHFIYGYMASDAMRKKTQICIISPMYRTPATLFKTLKSVHPSWLISMLFSSFLLTPVYRLGAESRMPILKGSVNGVRFKRSCKSCMNQAKQGCLWEPIQTSYSDFML